MITPLNIYLIMQADKISNALIFITVMAVVAMLMALIAYDCNFARDKKFPITKKMVFWVGLTFMFATAIPSTKTLCMMYALPAIVNSKAVQTDFPELYDIALQATKAKLKEVVTPDEGKK